MTTTGQFAHVPVDSIFVNREARQRKTLENIDELADSIARVGLIHPPVIERSGELRVGERRWTAVQQLGWTTIPVQYVDELDETELQLLEYEENVKRVNLPWQEDCMAVAHYHKLQESRDPSWTQAQTAEMLGMPRSLVTEKLSVAKELERGNARVVEAPKFSVAKNVVARVKERAETSSIAAAVAATPIIANFEKPAPRAVPIINEDFHEWAAGYSEDSRFNLIHCDFPYGINADQHDQGQAASQGGYADGFDVYTELIDTLEQNMDTVVATSAHLIFWFSMDYYQYTFDRLTTMKWKVNPFPLIWFKVDNTGILPDPQRGYRRNYETAFFASRGDRKLTAKGAVSNITAHPGRGKSLHMSEKPIPMLKHFLGSVVDEYTSFLDPTCGSGNAVKAAQQLGAPTVLGIERDNEFYQRAKEAYYAQD